MCLHVCMCLHLRVCLIIYLLHASVFVCVCLCVCVCVCMCVCVCACVCVSVCVSVCVCAAAICLCQSYYCVSLFLLSSLSSSLFLSSLLLLSVVVVVLPKCLCVSRPVVPEDLWRSRARIRHVHWDSLLGLWSAPLQTLAGAATGHVLLLSDHLSLTGQHYGGWR